MFHRIAIATAVSMAVVLLAGSPTHAATLTTAPTTATVSAGKSGLTMRAGPTSASAAIGALRNGTKVALVCQALGPRTKGRVRTSDRWDRLTNGAYVSDAYITRGTAPTACPPPTPPPAVTHPTGPPPHTVTIVPPTGAVAIGAWVAPVPGRGISGFRTASRPDHDGVDLMAVRFTPIHAAADGTVITVVCNTSGPSCDVDGGAGVGGCGWYVEIRHAGDIITRYCHMVQRPAVVAGQQVTVNQVIGLVGTSGHSSGPHVHFEVHFGTRLATRLNAIDPADFMRKAGAPIT